MGMHHKHVVKFRCETPAEKRHGLQVPHRGKAVVTLVESSARNILRLCAGLPGGSMGCAAGAGAPRRGRRARRGGPRASERRWLRPQGPRCAARRLRAGEYACHVRDGAGACVLQANLGLNTRLADLPRVQPAYCCARAPSSNVAWPPSSMAALPLAPASRSACGAPAAGLALRHTSKGHAHAHVR